MKLSIFSAQQCENPTVALRTFPKLSQKRLKNLSCRCKIGKIAMPSWSFHFFRAKNVKKTPCPCGPFEQIHKQRLKKFAVALRGRQLFWIKNAKNPPCPCRPSQNVHKRKPQKIVVASRTFRFCWPKNLKNPPCPRGPFQNVHKRKPQKNVMASWTFRWPPNAKKPTVPSRTFSEFPQKKL